MSIRERIGFSDERPACASERDGALAEVFRAYEGVQAVYLFGSAAEGRSRPESDLDLGVWPRRGHAVHRRKLDLLADLTRAGFGSIDLVFLDRAAPVVRYEAVRLNRLVYAAGDFPRGTAFSNVVRAYLDVEPYLRVQRAAYKKRLLRSSPTSEPNAVVRPEVIRRRLEKLDEYLSVLEAARRDEREAFLGDPRRYGSAERFLHLAIETLTDMANHVAAEEGLGPIDQYSDLPALFADEGWVSSELAERWTRMVGFRNILVHDYLDVDRTIVYDVLQNDLDDFRKLRAAFARFL